MKFQRSYLLGLAFMAPALVVVLVFFVAPAFLTGVFSFTNMSTATGIRGGEYVLNQASISKLGNSSIDADTIDVFSKERYVIDDIGIDALVQSGKQKLAEELKRKHLGEVFETRRKLERALKKLKNKPRSTRQIKAVATGFKRSILNQRFASDVEFKEAIAGQGVLVSDDQLSEITQAAYTGWTWTSSNFSLLFSLPSTARYAINSVIYVSLTLTFNVCFGLFLAIATFYMPKGQAATFRTIWFLPRILPPVLYVLMWKWMTWDTGFISSFLLQYGVTPKNWMLDTSTHAWVVVILINGFVGASMGMILFASAIRAIPESILYASEVDGASRWQQIWFIILPQLRWPILFVTSYQTLSLLTSFEYIYLSTDGGPGRTTEVWALAAFHTALNNYAGNLQYGLGAALALVLVVIGIVASLFYLKMFNFRELVARPRIER